MGHAEDSIGLYESANGRSLLVEKLVHLEVGKEPVSLAYTTAERGRIVQVRDGCRRIHYFFDEPEGRKMIDEDEKLNRVSYSEILEHAPSH